MPGEVFAPGVQVVEKEAFPAVQPPGSVFSGVVVRSKRGPDNVVTFLSNLDQFLKRYGGADGNNPYGYETVRDYFNEGGQGLYTVRVVGAGAVKAKKDLGNIDASIVGTRLTLEASSAGAWGNGTYVTTLKYATRLTLDPGGSGVIARFASLAGVEVGDVCKITDGSATFVGYVAAINTGTKDVTFRSDGNNVPAFATPANAIVTCVTTHKAKTVLAASVTGSAFTQIPVASAAAIDKGALLALVSSTGLRVAECTVTEKNGNILSVAVAYADGSSTIPAGSVVVSMGFNLTHVVEGETEVFSYLNLESADAVNYVETHLAQSEYLRATVTAAAPGSYVAFAYPEAVAQSFLSTGADGAAPTDDDYLGQNTGKAYQHGLKLFDNISVLPQFGIPAASIAVQQGADGYAQTRGDTVFVCDAPETADTLDELLTYRNVTLNLQSSYSALYGPWLVESDALTPGATVRIPPTGKVLGTYSEVAMRRGPQKPPANEALSGVIDVAARFTEQEFALLNDAGVNLIRNVSGRGIRIMGARTLWPVADRKQFVNVRRILNAVKIAFRDFGVNLVQEPNDDVLWKKMSLEGNKALASLWTQGWFFPRNDSKKAYFFVCDATTNTEALRTAAKVRAIAGINPVLPGELIRFEVTLYDGGTININEI